MVSDNIELDFGIARPVLVSGNQGLQAKGVGKSFNKRRVVRNVSLGLQRGEAVGLLGPNGAGKTTTFYMLAGLLPADEGQVFIDGRDVTGMPHFPARAAWHGISATGIQHLSRLDGRTKYPRRSRNTRRP